MATAVPATPHETVIPQPKTDAEAIANIEATLNAGNAAPAAPAKKPKDEPEVDAPEAEDEALDTEADADETDAGEDDASDEPTDEAEQAEESDEEAPTKTAYAKLKDELAEMKGAMKLLTEQLAAKSKEAPITDEGEGQAANPSPQSDTASEAAKKAGRLAQMREKIKAAKGTDEKPGEWREIIEALEPILEDIAADIEEDRGARTKAEETQRQEQANRATNGIDQLITKIAKSDKDIGEMLGTTTIAGGGHSERHLKMRQAVFIEARHQMARSHERVNLGLAQKPMTDTQAITAAIRAITGKSVKSFVGNPKDTEAEPKQQPKKDEAQERRDAAIRNRARQVRPVSGGGGQVLAGKTEAQKTQAAISDIDNWFKGR